MDYRQTYEALLQTLCEAYNRMFKTLEQIEQCDETLTELSALNRPDVREVCAVTSRKERLIQYLDDLSISTEPLQTQLDGIKALCHEVCVHPMYYHLEDLQLLTYYYIRRVINKEDINNPEIIDRLNGYRESLALDVKISEVPRSQRHVFMFVPDKRK